MESASEMHVQDGGLEREESAAPTDETYRSHFASWLSGMPEEARKLAFLLEREEASAPARRYAADSLNQLLHAADLIPEGTEALGYLETLFAFRVLAAELSEPAFSAQRLPKPRPVKVVPVEPVVVEAPDADRIPAGEAGEKPVEASISAAEPGEEAGAIEAAESADAAAELEAAADPDVSAEAEAMAEPAEVAEPNREPEGPLDGTGEAGTWEAGAEAPEAEPSQPDVAEAAQHEQEEDEEEQPERAQASDESYGVVRRLAAQASLVRAFLGAEDAERLRTIVLQLRNRASRGRSGKQILFEPEQRAAAASDARDWAELYEVPEFGTSQHDLLRLRTFMKTRVRRVPA